MRVSDLRGSFCSFQERQIARKIELCVMGVTRPRKASAVFCGRSCLGLGCDREEEVCGLRGKTSFSQMFLMKTKLLTRKQQLTL